MEYYDVCFSCSSRLKQKWRIDRMRARRDITMTEAEIHGCARRLALLVFRDNEPPEAAADLATLRKLLMRVDELQVAYDKLLDKRAAQLERQDRRR